MGCVWCVDNGERFERLVESLLMLFWIMLYYENGCNIMKMVISSFFVNISFALFWDMVVVRGCTISRVVSRAAMDIIFRGMYRAPRRLLLSRVVSCAATDAWTDMSPMGPGLRDSGCVSLRKTCITIFDIASHGIAHFYYWWTWTCILLILWLFLCEACDCWILSCYWECVNW